MRRISSPGIGMETMRQSRQYVAAFCLLLVLPLHRRARGRHNRRRAAPDGEKMEARKEGGTCPSAPSSSSSSSSSAAASILAICGQKSDRGRFPQEMEAVRSSSSNWRGGREAAERARNRAPYPPRLPKRCTACLSEDSDIHDFSLYRQQLIDFSCSIQF